MIGAAGFSALWSPGPLHCALAAVLAQVPMLVAVARRPRPALFPRAVAIACMSRWVALCTELHVQPLVATEWVRE